MEVGKFVSRPYSPFKMRAAVFILYEPCREIERVHASRVMRQQVTLAYLLMQSLSIEYRRVASWVAVVYWIISDSINWIGWRPKERSVLINCANGVGPININITVAMFVVVVVVVVAFVAVVGHVGTWLSVSGSANVFRYTSTWNSHVAQCE